MTTRIGSLFFAVMLALAGLLAAPATNAEAGGRGEWWRGCGGHTYEGCDGVERGPYARQRGRGYGGYRQPDYDDYDQGYGQRGGGYGQQRGREIKVQAYKRTYTSDFHFRNNWHMRCVNGVCVCMSGVCPDD